MRNILRKMVCFMLGHLFIVEPDGNTNCLRCKKYLGITGELYTVKHQEVTNDTK